MLRFDEILMETCSNSTKRRKVSENIGKLSRILLRNFQDFVRIVNLGSIGKIMKKILN